MALRKNRGYTAERWKSLSFCSSKNICRFSSRSQVLSRGSLSPTLPLLPQPLHPPLLSNPAALPLLCILHLLDYSAVSKHSTGVALNAVRSVTCPFFCSAFLSINPAAQILFIYFVVPLYLECICWHHNGARFFFVCLLSKESLTVLNNNPCI